MARVDAMRAVQVVTPTGPADVRVRDIEPPSPGHDDVLVEVHSVGVAFPDLLLSRGEYQFKPEPPFTLGVDFAGTVVSGPEGYAKGERVAGVLPYGGAAELVVAPPSELGSRTHDSYLTSVVKTRFLEATDKLSATHVKVVTENQVAYLLGLLKRQEAKDAAELARTTDGVKKVVTVFEYLD